MSVPVDQSTTSERVVPSLPQCRQLPPSTVRRRRAQPSGSSLSLRTSQDRRQMPVGRSVRRDESAHSPHGWSTIGPCCVDHTQPATADFLIACRTHSSVTTGPLVWYTMAVYNRICTQSCRTVPSLSAVDIAFVTIKYRLLLHSEICWFCFQFSLFAQKYDMTRPSGAYMTEQDINDTNC